MPLKFAAFALPVTASADNVPTEVMLGCALVVTVAAVPEVNAYVALATVPVTFAPVRAVRFAPLPLK